MEVEQTDATTERPPLAEWSSKLFRVWLIIGCVAGVWPTVSDRWLFPEFATWVESWPPIAFFPFAMLGLAFAYVAITATIRLRTGMIGFLTGFATITLPIQLLTWIGAF